MVRQHIQLSIYAKRPLVWSKCAKARDIIRDKGNGAITIPKRGRLNTRFPFCVTKTVSSCSPVATCIDDKRLERRTQFYSLRLRLCQDGSALATML